MVNSFKRFVANSLEHFGWRLYQINNQVLGDNDPEFDRLYKLARPYTMTSIERMYAVYKAANYIAAKGIAGDIVECGVWRGGSSLIAAEVLARAGNIDRTLYMFDTFSGMSEPSEKDKGRGGALAFDTWKERAQDDHNDWDYAPLEEVEQCMSQTAYPQQKIKFVKGKIEDTIPDTMPENIALLRLDTDWYESTYHEMVHLFPRLVVGGILIIDDYGHWQGAREAIDQYLAENDITLLLNRIDYTGRIALKV